MVLGSGEPLPAGHFTVTQGFGCTTVAAEPSPPASYSCPPDAAHPAWVRFHTGIDLAAAYGVPVAAVAVGTVHIVESPTGFGLHILLTPLTAASASTVYLYGHLSDLAVPDGETVAAGTVIGFVGSSGNSSGPHLHFEVDVGGVPVNPCPTFPPGYLVPAGIAATGCLAWAAPT
jgi:murein DD-endopeptidase MepM/ murein hydrolase activator NlpD